jgi:hypothetical protein
VPSSVLLAILVGAGVLALMPALVRRYDTAVRAQAELRTSSMRVLLRRRRRRTVPGPYPINPPSALLANRIVGRAAVADALTPGDAESDSLVRSALVARDEARRASQQPSRQVAARPLLEGAQLVQWRQYRRRRVLLAFTLLFVLQVCGVVFVGTGFWAGLAVSGVLMLGYLVRLRSAAAAERRRAAADRARRHRAYEFVRVATHDRVPHNAAARAAAWLATPREERRRPTREVVRVLTMAGREAVRTGDGTWAVRKTPVPAPAPRPARTASRPAARAAAPVMVELDEALPRAVNM